MFILLFSKLYISISVNNSDDIKKFLIIFNEIDSNNSIKIKIILMKYISYITPRLISLKYPDT